MDAQQTVEKYWEHPPQTRAEEREFRRARNELHKEECYRRKCTNLAGYENLMSTRIARYRGEDNGL